MCAKVGFRFLCGDQHRGGEAGPKHIGNSTIFFREIVGTISNGGHGWTVSGKCFVEVPRVFSVFLHNVERYFYLQLPPSSGPEISCTDEKITPYDLHANQGNSDFDAKESIETSFL